LVASAIFVFARNFPGGAEAVAERIAVGSKAPDFSAKTSKGDSLRLSDFEGRAVVLSFVFCAKTGNAEYGADTDSEVVFLRSMDYQYTPKGLVILLVDASYLLTGQDTDRNEFVNFGYDRQLEGIQLLEDNLKKKVALQYGVTKLPTTFMIAQDGTVTQRLEGLALSAQLAAGIEALVGAPWYRENDESFFEKFNPSSPIGETRPVTPAEAVFRGFDMARRLTDNLWLVDGGKVWTGGAGNPTRWLVLGAGGDVALRVTAENADTGEIWTSQDIVCEKIPADEAEQLLVNLSGADPDKLYMAMASIGIPSAGYYNIRAEVVRIPDFKIIDSGVVQISAGIPRE